jgi:hypothetical protein
VRSPITRERSSGRASSTIARSSRQGIIDYRPIFKAAEKAGLEHYFVEQEGPFTRMSQLDAARQAFDYVVKIA